MTHLAGYTPTDYFAEDLVKRRLCFPVSRTTHDNREAWREAYSASKRPLREAGRSFEPFTLEEMK